MAQGIERFLEDQRAMNGGFVVYQEERNVAGLAGLGRELRSPQLNAGGARYYELMREPNEGDPVVIWLDEATHSLAQVVGELHNDATIDWQDRQGVSAYQRDLANHQQLPLPLTLDDIRERREELRRALAELKDEYGTTYSAFTYQTGNVRPTQGQYLSVLPHEIIDLFPGLQQQIAAYMSGDKALDLPLADSLIEVDPSLYQAPEDVEVRDGQPVERSGEVMSEAINLHNSWVNRLRTRVNEQAKNSTAKERFGLIEIPQVRGRPDLAYVVPTRGRGRRIVIVEVKTISEKNEGEQFGRALEELARYGGAAEEQWDDPVERVVFVSQRPHDSRYVRWLASLNVSLSWPGNWPPSL